MDNHDYFIYSTFRAEGTNKRRKTCLPDYIDDDTEIVDEPTMDIIDLTNDKPIEQINVPTIAIVKPTIAIVKPTIAIRVIGKNKKSHMAIARQIRYNELIDLCGNEKKLLKIIKLLDCKQYVNVGENDVLYQDSKNPKNIISKAINHGEPIKQLFM